MNVKKSDAITLKKGLTFNVQYTTTNLFETADGDVSWNQRVRNTFEQALLQVKSVPQTSESSTASNAEFSSRSGVGNSRISTAAFGLGMTAARGISQ